MRIKKESPGAGGSARGAGVSISDGSDADHRPDPGQGTADEPSVEELRARWPAAFNDARPPLKIDIHRDMGIHGRKWVMARWVRHPTYLRNVIARGERVDLDGRPQPPTPIDEFAQGEALRALMSIRIELECDLWDWKRARRSRRLRDEIAKRARLRPPAGLTLDEALAELSLPLPKPTKPSKPSARRRDK
jgi:hypothetical protein